MSIRVGSTSTYVNGIHVGNRGLGVLGQTILDNTSTGDYGPGILYNDVEAGDEAKEFRTKTVSGPTNGGVLFVYEDGSLESSVVPNTFTYETEVDGTSVGTASVTISIAYSAGSDITTTSWTATPGTPFYSRIDEYDAVSTSDYITSPNMASPTPITLGWASSVPVGTWDLTINIKQAALTGSEVRIVMLDASNAVVGTSSWVAATGSFATTVVPITTSDISTKFRIEVQ